MTDLVASVPCPQCGADLVLDAVFGDGIKLTVCPACASTVVVSPRVERASAADTMTLSPEALTGLKARRKAIMKTQGRQVSR